MFKTAHTNLQEDQSSMPLHLADTAIYCDIFENMSSETDASHFDQDNLTNMLQMSGVNLEDCRRIERETREQGNSQAWYFERSKRLTASIFGRIVRRRENIFPKSIIEQIGKGIETRKLKTAALQWGIDNEKVALAKYKQEFSESYQVIECGLMINPKWP